MSTLLPSTLLYSQAISKINDLMTRIDTARVKDVTSIAQELADIISKFEASAGTPLLNYESVEESEPPLSAKMNRFWNGAAKDITILEDQLTTIQASAVFLHNFITTQLLQLQLQNEALRENANTLQLLSNSASSGTILFGSDFSSLHGFDLNFPISDSLAQLFEGKLVLGYSGQVINFTQKSIVSLLQSPDGSLGNGFVGNNQEIQNPSTTSIDPVTNEPLYQFVAQTLPANSLTNLTDGNPATWVEYEHYQVPQSDQNLALGFGFNYLTSNSISGDSSAVTSLVNWANVPDNFQLSFGCQFDLGAPQTINYISYNPYGLQNNQNYPVFVQGVQISADSTSWRTLSPSGIWVGTNANLQTARSAPNVSLGAISWTFDPTSVQFIRLFVNQSTSYQTNIGHLYYLDKANSREEGPIPLVTNANFYDDPSNYSNDVLTQHREFFIGQRWAIGIRDFTVQQNSYQSSSSIITKPFYVNGAIDQLSVDADVNIPASFPTDQEWVFFFVSPDNGTSWLPISLISDTPSVLTGSAAAILSFNNPLPASFRDPKIAYYNIGGAVNSVRLKIQITRPTDNSFTAASPVVNSFKIKVVTV